MIFVTAGTHEQPFNRLVSYMDNLKRDNFIDEEVVIQTGFSTYEPNYCKWSRLLPYQEMIKHVADARIVITHGGPSSFIMPLQMGKIPIVVPRRKEFNEHVNNHQLDFCQEIASRQKNIICIEDIDSLKDILSHYDEIVSNMNIKQNNNNAKFCERFEKIVDTLFE